MLPFHMSNLSPTCLNICKVTILMSLSTNSVFCVFISLYWFIFLTVGYIFLFPCLYQTPNIVNFTLLYAAYFCSPIKIFQLSYSEIVWSFQGLSLWLIVPHHSEYHFEYFAQSHGFPLWLVGTQPIFCWLWAQGVFHFASFGWYFSLSCVSFLTCLWPGALSAIFGAFSVVALPSQVLYPLPPRVPASTS